MSLDLKRWYFPGWFVVIKYNPKQVVVVCCSKN